MGLRPSLSHPFPTKMTCCHHRTSRRICNPTTRVFRSRTVLYALSTDDFNLLPRRRFLPLPHQVRRSRVWSLVPSRKEILGRAPSPTPLTTSIRYLRLRSNHHHGPVNGSKMVVLDVGHRSQGQLSRSISPLTVSRAWHTTVSYRADGWGASSEEGKAR